MEWDFVKLELGCCLGVILLAAIAAGLVIGITTAAFFVGH